MGGDVHNRASATSANLVQAGRIYGDLHFHDSRPARPAPRQLPAPPRWFTGRAEESRRLDDLVRGQRAPVTVVSGPGGVGKTALVVEWAWSRADEFPDGQLYADLRGYGPDEPLDPTEVLGSFLRALGVPDGEVPGPAHERAGHFRSVLAGRRVLVVLDNAVSADQVRPLLPGNHSCPVLVTSRDALPGLAVHDNAESLGVEVFDRGRSIDLLRALLGDRVVGDDAAADLAGHCAGLPLALRIVGRLALSRPEVPLAAVAAELADERERLDALDLGDDARSAVRPVLSWSYHRLPEPTARAFRLLGAHPGREFDVPQFAALCGATRARATRVLRELVDKHLVVESSPGRYSSHDLLRLYAAEVCAAGDPAEVAAARTRLLDHYLHTADRADRLVTPNRYRLPPVGSAEHAVSFDDRAAALSWLHATWSDAVALGRLDCPELDTRRWRLAYTLRGYFFLAKQWRGWIDSHEAALAACLRLGDRHAEARIRNDLGRAMLECGRPEAGAVHYETAQRLFAEVGDRHGWSNAVANRAVLLRRTGDLEGALRLNATALDYYIEAGARRNTAIAWRSRAKMHVELGALDEAAADLERAIAIFAQLDVPLDLAEAHNLGGVIASRRGQRARAEAEHLKALEAGRACGSRYEEAEALRSLGRLSADRGAVDPAATRWRAALELYRELGSPKADEVAAELRALLADTGDPASPG
ncbi:ATP-binding protein [Actinosynnema sp. NPDC059335]|uniref:ATP-binding protein n=1 Tax=Actinosynnema sp. NPDC059335 TaxID=3346804 RepID=UPI00366D2E45